LAIFFSFNHCINQRRAKERQWDNPLLQKSRIAAPGFSQGVSETALQPEDRAANIEVRRELPVERLQFLSEISYQELASWPYQSSYFQTS
jgi:hypothetical protein